MSTDPTIVSNHLLPRIVHVAIYEHRHGTDVRVFLAREQALFWRTVLAKEWWRNEFDDDPPSDDEIGEEYFSRMLERDEFFTTMSCNVEIGHQTAAEPNDRALIVRESAKGHRN